MYYIYIIRSNKGIFDMFNMQKIRFFYLILLVPNLCFSANLNDPSVETNDLGLAQFHQKDLSKENLLMFAEKKFVFSPRSLRWYAYASDGSLIKSGRASGGKSYCKDIGRSCRTVSGTYRVQRKGSASCRSTRYPVGGGGAPMPYCMFYSRYYAVHGSYDVPNYNASHGCVRVQPSAARWLHQNFMNIGTKVVIGSY